MDRSSILRASTNSYKQVGKRTYLLFYYLQIPRRIELCAGRERKENAAATQGGTRFPADRPVLRNSKTNALSIPKLGRRSPNETAGGQHDCRR